MTIDRVGMMMFLLQVFLVSFFQVPVDREGHVIVIVGEEEHCVRNIDGGKKRG